jgi:diacylglycerol kinase family enzyme
VGRIDSRYFLFSAGMGLDAEVARRVEADPEGKRERGEWLFVKHAFRAGLSQYRGADPWIELRVEGEEPVRGILMVCCKGRPFTYFKRFPVDACPEARLDLGLDAFVMKRMRSSTVPRLVWALFVSRAHVRWKRSGAYFHDFPRATVVADRPTPVQVDGDYIGEWQEATLEVVRDALDLVV